jgi:hypothetical protein
MKEHIMQNGDYARLKHHWLTTHKPIVKIVNCSEVSNILVRLVDAEVEDDGLFALALGRWPHWYVNFRMLDVISDPNEVDNLEARICLKNL